MLTKLDSRLMLAVLIGFNSTGMDASETVGATNSTGSLAVPFYMTVRAVNSETSPIVSAIVSQIEMGSHPRGYKEPSYTTDTNGCAKFTCATNFGGISIRADGFFGAQVNSEDLSTNTINVVKLRRSRLKGETASENALAIPACERLDTPADLSDADVISLIRAAIADPSLRDLRQSLPRSLPSIEIRSVPDKQEPIKVDVLFELSWGDGYGARLVRTNEAWRVETAGRMVY